MKRILLTSTLIIGLGSGMIAQINWSKSLEKISKEVNTNKVNTTKALSNEEIIKGLKEALEIGSQNSSSLASKLDGFNKNTAIRIPFPEEAIKVKKTMESMGMKNQIEKFETTLNRAAEEACKSASPVFIDAIKQMTISDGLQILKGADNAATAYMKEKTNEQLTQKFTPLVKEALNKVQITSYWNPIISKYNQIPGVEKKNPNLEQYATSKAIDGLFKLLAEEEMKIRKNPADQVTDLLKKVFGSK